MSKSLKELAQEGRKRRAKTFQKDLRDYYQRKRSLVWAVAWSFNRDRKWAKEEDRWKKAFQRDVEDLQDLLKLWRDPDLKPIEISTLSGETLHYVKVNPSLLGYEGGTIASLYRYLREGDHPFSVAWIKKDLYLCPKRR